MICIIGGSGQGRLSYAMQKYELQEWEVFSMENIETQGIPMASQSHLLHHMEYFATHCIRQNKNIQEELQRYLPQWQECILILQEVGCGLVPITPEERQWRDIVGAMNQILTANADVVERVFCGLGMQIKGV